MFFLCAIRRSRSNRRRILLHIHAHLKKRACILRALFHDRFGNRLCALKLRACIEIHALFAAMKLVATPRAYSRRHKSWRQNISASAAARPQYCSNHPRGSRTYLLRPRTSGLLRTSLALFRLIGALITMLLVFSIQLTLTTLLVFAKIGRTNGLTGQRAAIGDTSRTVNLQNYTRRYFLSAEILTGTAKR